MVDGAPFTESQLPNAHGGMLREGHMGDSCPPTKVFVGGISWQTSEDMLRAYFSEFGAINDATLMRDKYTGQPRGFAFVKFEDLAAVEKVLKVTEHTLDGRNIDVKRAIPKSEAPGPSLPRFPVMVRSPSEATKVFVGGLPPNVNAAEFRAYFERYGCVTDAVVMFDRSTQRSRGFGFVTFETEAEVQQVLAATHEIGGKAVEVKRAEPKAVRWNSDYGYQNGYNNGYGGGYRGNGFNNGGFNGGFRRGEYHVNGNGYAVGYGGRRATFPPGGGGGDSPTAYGVYGPYTNGTAFYGYGAYPGPGYAAAFGGYGGGFGGDAAGFAAGAGGFGGSGSPTAGLSPTGGMLGNVPGASDGSGGPPPHHQYIGFPVAFANGGGAPQLPPDPVPGMVPVIVPGPPPTSSSPVGDPNVPAAMYQSVDFGAMRQQQQQQQQLAGPAGPPPPPPQQQQQQQQQQLLPPPQQQGQGPSHMAAQDARVHPGYAHAHVNAVHY